MDEPKKGEWFVELSVNRARKLAGDGRVEEAYDILVGVSGHNNRKTYLQLRSEWRQKLLAELRKRFTDLSVYPMRAPLKRSLKEYTLKSREMYVYELFDGVTSLEDALAVSPVDELDTLRSYARLVELGLLTVAARV